MKEQLIRQRLAKEKDSLVSEIDSGVSIDGTALIEEGEPASAGSPVSKKRMRSGYRNAALGTRFSPPVSVGYQCR